MEKIVNREQPTTARIPFLDGLRGVAALAVVFGHTVQYNGKFGLSPYRFIHVNGVWGFFVLSSFLLTVLLYSRLVKDRQENCSIQRTLGEYAIRRFMRVYPFYFIVCLFLMGAPLSWFTTRAMGPDFYSWQSLLLMRSPTLAWTIPIEMQSFLLIPVIVFSVYYARKMWILPTLGCILYAWIHAQYYPMYPIDSSTANLRDCLPIFAYGAVSGIVYVKFNEFITTKDIRSQSPKICRMAGIIADVVCWMLVAMFAWIATPECHRIFGKRVRLHDPKYQAPIFSAILLLAIMSQRSFTRFFEWSFLAYCGKVSYGMYLTHLWAIWVHEEFLQWYGYEGFSVIFCMAFALATLTYYTIEVTIQKITSSLVQIWHTYFVNGDSRLAITFVACSQEPQKTGGTSFVLAPHSASLFRTPLLLQYSTSSSQSIQGTDYTKISVPG